MRITKRRLLSVIESQQKAAEATMAALADVVAAIGWLDDRVGQLETELTMIVTGEHPGGRLVKEER